jgi:hypothetical protein
LVAFLRLPSSILRPPRARRAALAVAILAAAPGCSWIFVQKAPSLPIPPDAPLGCTESVAVPALDIAGSAASGVVGILFVAAALSYPVVENCPPNGDCITPGDRNGMVAVGASMVALGGVVAFSAAYGMSETSRCREAAGWKAGCLSGLEDDCWRLHGPRATGTFPPPPPVPAAPKSPFGPPTRPRKAVLVARGIRPGSRRPPAGARRLAASRA